MAGPKTIRESIEVDVPIEKAYETWHNFENFPEFMSSVKDVRNTGPNETLWVTRIMGVRKEWHATIITEDPPRTLIWRSEGDVGMDGRANFLQLSPTRTRLDVEFTWRGGGLVEDIGHALGIDDATVKKDLREFKEFVEGRKARRTPATR